jgi:integrase/recombinase XerD
MKKDEWINKLKRELHLLNYAATTIETYASCLAVFLSQYKKFNGYKEVDDLKSFLLTITNRSYHKQFTATIHHFYKLVLKKPLSLQDIPYPRKTHYLPQVFSITEVARLLAATENMKHRAILQLMYACGLRIGEVPKILIAHIESDRHVLLIKGGKGFKDRFVPLPVDTLTLLRNYAKEYQPKNYLFEGWGSQSYSVRSIQQIFKASLKRAGIYKTVTPHALRHSRATHLCDAGIDIYKLKDFLGHCDIKTTEIYLHLSKLALVNHIAAADKLISQSLMLQLEAA